MNACSYFSVLRPVRSIALGLFYGAIAANSTLILGAQAADRTFAVMALGLPLGLGAFLAGPLHEPLHRNFARWLPDLRNRLRNWHVGTLLVVGLLLMIATTLVLPDLPLATAAGLIAVGLTLPLINSRRRVWGGLIAAIVLVAVGANLHTVRAGLIAFPNLTLAIGVVLALLNVRIGFDADGVRRRATKPFICMLSIFSGPKVAAAQRRNALRAAGDSGRRERLRTFPTVTGSLWSWMATVWRAQGTDAHAVGRVLLPLVLVVVLAYPVFMATVFTMLRDHHVLGVDLLDAISAMGQLAPLEASAKVSRLLLLISPLCLLGAVAGRGPPAIRFPVTRDRFAQIEFAMLALSAAIAAVVWALGTGLLIAVGLYLKHEPVRPGDFRAIAGMILVAAPLVPLVFATRLIRSPFPRMLTGLFAAATALGLTQVLIAFQAPFVFSAAGFALCLAGTAATTWVCWRVTRAHWRAADLASTN